MLGPGKRLRPLSTLAFFIGSGGKLEGREDVMRVACAMELMHDSTLVLDDIMDEDEMRRNSPTVVKTFLEKYKSKKEDVKTEKFLFTTKGTTYATSIAIMIANIMYSMSLKLGLQCDVRIGQMLMELFKGLNYGQIIDMSTITTVEEYYLNIMYKTAIFFQITAKVGLIMGERSENDMKLGDEWGKHFGIGFQMRDDLLDIDLKNAKCRTVGSDIKEGKKTCLIWTALEEGVLSDEEREFIKGTVEMDVKVFEDEETFEKVISILRGKPSQIVKENIVEHHRQAISALEELHLTEDVFVFLKKLTDLLLQ